MKSTHLKTPRTLAECHLQPSMDPIERPEENHSNRDDLIVIICSLIAGLAALVVTSWG